MHTRGRPFKNRISESRALVFEDSVWEHAVNKDSPFNNERGEGEECKNKLYEKPKAPVCRKGQEWEGERDVK